MKKLIVFLFLILLCSPSYAQLEYGPFSNLSSSGGGGSWTTCDTTGVCRETGNVGIGTSDPGATLEVNGDMIIGGSGNDITLQNSEYIENVTDDFIRLGGGGGTSDSTLDIDLDGSVQFTPSTSGININGKLSLGDTITSSVALLHVYQESEENTTTYGGNIEFINDGTGITKGLNVRGEKDGAGGSNDILGLDVQANFDGTGTQAEVFGIKTSGDVNNAAGTITDFYGAYISAGVETAGTITNNYALVTALGDTHLGVDTVADNADGHRLYIRRYAAEGNDYISLGIDQYRAATMYSNRGLTVSSGNTLTLTGNNSTTLNGTSGDIILNRAADEKIRFNTMGSAIKPSADTTITAAGGITVTRKLMRVVGDGGAIDITANPQIADGEDDGQELIVQGTHDTNTVTLETGNGLKINGTIILEEDDNISLIFDSGQDLWIETGRVDM